MRNKVLSALALIDDAVRRFDPCAVWALFSGGDDSLTMTHLAAQHPAFTGAAHLNTGIGIEQTREFVRQTCTRYGWKLREIRAREDCGQDYAEMVKGYGFPGPGYHREMYQRLKERPLRVLIRDSKKKRRDRVLLLSGARSSESERRMGTTRPLAVEGVRVWITPIHDWTRPECLEYLRANNVPRNPVSRMIHMSGECLCGAFAHEGELEEIRLFFPRVAAEIEALQERVKRAGQKRCLWGRRPDGRPNGRLAKVPGPLCYGCAGDE